MRRPRVTAAAAAGLSRPALRRPGTRRRRALAAFALLLLLAFALDRLFPPPVPYARDGGAVVLAADGTPLRAFANREGVWRYPVTMDQV